MTLEAVKINNIKEAEDFIMLFKNPNDNNSIDPLKNYKSGKYSFPTIFWMDKNTGWEHLPLYRKEWNYEPLKSISEKATEFKEEKY